jgi:hypothetical protein
MSVKQLPERISRSGYAELSESEKEKYEPSYFFGRSERGVNFYQLKVSDER